MRGLIAFLLLLPSVAVMGQDEDSLAYEEYQPIVVNHPNGATVQVLPWGSDVPSFLPSKFIVSATPAKTVWCGPPGYYLLNAAGILKIVQIKGEVGPNPPDPPDPPDPPVDPPGTIAEIVADLTKNEVSNETLAKVFIKHAGIFERTEGNTSELFADWTSDMQKAIGVGNDYGGLRPWMSKYIQENWPMSNDTVAYFFSDVAKGLRL